MPLLVPRETCLLSFLREASKIEHTELFNTRLFTIDIRVD